VDNECQDIVEEPASAQMKEEINDSLSAGVVGAPATLAGRKEERAVRLQSTQDE
jgi:hypothetical protein